MKKKKKDTRELGIAVNYGWTCVASTEGGNELWGMVVLRDEDVKAFLLKDANASLPCGTKFQIRKRFPGMYGRSHGMGWYRNAEMDIKAEWGFVPTAPMHAPEGGYLLVGEYTTPTKAGRQ